MRMNQDQVDRKHTRRIVVPCLTNADLELKDRELVKKGFGFGLYSIGDHPFFSWRGCAHCGMAGILYDVIFATNARNKGDFQFALCGSCIDELMYSPGLGEPEGAEHQEQMAVSVA